ncbi:MAG: hypothetical protein F7C38_02250 [Desulfurococcales archaeon]|nr:hypothetical protein [Desulfurococcales archaeon]
MKKALTRLARIARRNPPEVYGPTPILEELSAMGVVDAMAQGGQPAGIELSEAVKARTYARYGHLAYINTFR